MTHTGGENTSSTLVREAEGPIRLPLSLGDGVEYFELHYFETERERWAAVTLGDITDGRPVLTRIESACFFGHVFGSRQCDCGYQLDEAFRQIKEEGRGLVIYGIDQDARGLGIKRHFQIYRMRQQEGLDTPEIYERFNTPNDNRDYRVVGEILDHIRVRSVELMTNNPERLRRIAELGVNVKRRALEATLDEYNMATLMLEKEDLGYEFSFKTHAHWLERVQTEVVGNIDDRAAIAVYDNAKVVAEWFGENWNVADHILQHLPEDASSLVIYLSDMPRLDELERYAGAGVSFVVAPFAHFPQSLVDEAKRVGVRLQDWGRENKYTEPRPQWTLVLRKAERDVYERESEQREVRR